MNNTSNCSFKTKAIYQMLDLNEHLLKCKATVKWSTQEEKSNHSELDLSKIMYTQVICTSKHVASKYSSRFFDYRYRRFDDINSELETCLQEQVKSLNIRIRKAFLSVKTEELDRIGKILFGTASAGLIPYLIVQTKADIKNAENLKKKRD